MKKRIISLVLNLLPALIWVFIYFDAINSDNPYALADMNRMAFVLPGIYVMFNSFFIKERMWYILCDIVFLITNGAGVYFASINYLKYADLLLVIDIQKESVGAAVAGGIIMFLVAYGVKLYVSNYEKVFGNNRR